MSEETDLQPQPDKPPATFAGLGKRIRSRTTDLLAIAIVLIGGFAVGGQVTRWWNADDSAADNAAPQAGAAAGNSAPFNTGDPVQLDLGCCGRSLERSQFPGERDAAAERLVARCLRFATTATVPQNPPDEGERKLLDQLRGEKPVAVTEDGTRLFRFDGPVMFATAVKSADASGDAPRAERIVCWAAAFPAGDNEWTLYVFGPAVGSAPSPDGAIDVPLPRGARPGLALRTGDGVAWRTFQTAEPVAAVRRRFERWFADNGWTRSRQAGEWTALFTHATGDRTMQVEVQLTPRSRNETTGLVIVQPAPAR